MKVTNIEKYPRYYVDVQHDNIEYTVHISVDMTYDQYFINIVDTGDDLPQSDALYAKLLDAAYTAIRAEKDSVSREDLLLAASLANPNVMSTPEMMHERLTKIHALINEMLQTPKIA